MKRCRSETYFVGGSTESTITTIASTLRPWATHLAALGGDVYSSLDMRGPPNIEALLQSKGMMLDLLRLDPRGGVFSQTTMCEALRTALAEFNTLDQFVDKGDKTKSDAELLMMCAYKLRVMCAHVRQKFDKGTLKNEEFWELFEVMRESASSRERRGRRLERVLDRPNPFMMFRTDEEETEEPDHDAVIVSYYMDHSALTAKCLWDNGRVEHADMYMKGPMGTAQAKWLQSGHVLDLDLPNSFVKSVHELAAPVMKKPVAASSEVLVLDDEVEPTLIDEDSGDAPEAPAVEEAQVAEIADSASASKSSKAKKKAKTTKGKDAVATHAPHAPPVKVRLAAGHHHSWTIVLQTSPKGKSQIMACTSARIAESGMEKITPLSVSQVVMKELEAYIAPLTGPVKGQPYVQKLRDLAFCFREALLTTTAFPTPEEVLEQTGLRMT